MMGLQKLILICGLVSIAFAQNVPAKSLQVPYDPKAPQIALTLQLPREEAPLPFDSYLPNTDQTYDPQSPAYYDLPVPSDNLEVPQAGDWNPDKDPSLYYDFPIELSKETKPTNLHPKKYVKEVFEKVKPSKPKEELVLVAVPVKDYLLSKKQEEKTNFNFEKAQNQKVKEPAVASTQVHEGFGQFVDGGHGQTNGQGQRVQFQMHGHEGPKTYKWGYDTGKGHNRQFRYEERNKDGYVKGHYGYFDKHGKLQLVHYDSHPHEGFHAEGNFGKF